MSFELNHDLLQSIADRCIFAVPEDQMLFFGIRGCLPLDPENQDFTASAKVRTVNVNNVNPRCIIGQWLPSKQQIAVYPGSTCPNGGGIAMAAKNGGDGANQLLTGYYTYAKGKHLQSKPNRGHRSFVQDEDRVVLRNSDDMDFDFEDRLWTGNPGDNLHAGWCQGVDGYYSSLGCQVLVGYPTTLDGERSESGPWVDFRRTAYNLDQSRFRYMLINGWEAEAMSENPTASRSVFARFGSTGALVGKIQEALRLKGLINFSPDNEFGPGTTAAVIRFQVASFGSKNTDGIVGLQTATALGLTDWPETTTKEATPKLADFTATVTTVTEAPLPKFAQADLGTAKGIDWKKARLNTGPNRYHGIVRNSVYVFAKKGEKPAVVIYQSKFAIDGDGAGGNHEGDPAYQAQTSLRDSAGNYLNSREVDFIVLPLPPKDGSPSLQDLGIGLGDLGFIIYENGHLLPVIYGDHGPGGKIGEGSMSAAKMLGINPDSNIGGIDAGEIPPGIVHLVFPGSAELTKIEPFPGTDLARTARTKILGETAWNKARALLEAFRSQA